MKDAVPLDTGIRVIHVARVDGSIRFLLLNQLLSLRADGYDMHAACGPGDHTSYIESQGVRVHHVHVARHVDLLSDFRSLVQLVRLFQQHRLTIVHVHTPKIGLLGQVAARLAGVPVVVRTLHGFYFHEHMPPLKRAFFIAMERVAGLCSDAILSQNSEDVETAVQQGICKPDKISHLGNGIDMRLFDPSRFSGEVTKTKKTELGLPPDAPVVGIVGRLVREKGHVEFLEAMRLVIAEVPATYAICMGMEAPEKPDALSPSIFQEYGLADRVKFLGFRLDMPELYAVMDLLVLPSHREGFPRAPMEASAMGIPVVATDIRGCRQAVVDGENGLLVPVRDDQALARAILELLGDKDLARRMGRRGRAIAEERFDEQLVFRRVKEAYQRLLVEKGVLTV